MEFGLRQTVAVGSNERHSFQPAIERLQALAGISRSALNAFAVYKAISLYTCVCCHSNETCAPIANPPNSAQLEGTSYHSPKLHLRACAVMWACGEGQRDRDTDRHTDGRGQYIFFVSAMPHAKCTDSENLIISATTVKKLRQIRTAVAEMHGT